MDIDSFIKNNTICAIYFSSDGCSVCKSLKPKLFESLKDTFELLKIKEVDVSSNQDIAARFNVFAIPTLLVFCEGKEFIRKTRYMSVSEVICDIKRVYELVVSSE